MKIPIRILVSGVNVIGSQEPVLDMFGDEGISIKSVVKDLNDPAKLFTEFSRSFTVPASKRNNAIFKHYYNIDITNSLDTRELIPAKILMNNTTYKVGNIQVEGVRMSGGQPMHYKIKFIGKLSELARNIGQDKLSSLDFSTDNLSTFNPKTQFSNDTFRDLVYPLSARSDRFVFDSSKAASGIDGATNIAYHSSGTHVGYGVKEQDLTGAMRVGRIIETIEAKYGLNFSGAIDNDYITDLYLWLNKVDQSRDGEPYQAYASSYTSATLTDVDINAESIVFTGANTYPQERYKLRVKGVWTGDVVLKLLADGSIIDQVEVSGDFTNYFNVFSSAAVVTVIAESQLSATVNVTVEIVTEEFDRDYYYGDRWITSSTTTITAVAGIGTAGVYNITNHIPDMKVMDFLSSLFKMFNLIAEVDDSSNVTTKHFDHFMSQGTVKDVTKYINTDGYDVNRPNVYSAMQFEFSEAKTALELGYIHANGDQYGELAYEIIGDQGFRLSGNEYALKVDNQRIPLEPLTNQDNQALTSINYCLFADLKGATQQTDAAFTYIRRVTGLNFGDSSVSWENGTGVDEITSYIQPSNTYARTGVKPIESNVVMGLFFGEETDENNIYNHTSGLGLWKGFYRGTTAMMFEEDKRSVSFTADLPQGVILNLSLADTLLISNSYYNINSIETNYLTGKSKLGLTLVGRARLPETSLIQTEITNDSAVQILYITYMNTSGSLAKTSIGIGATSNYFTIGGVVSHSHDNYTSVGIL